MMRSSPPPAHRLANIQDLDDDDDDDDHFEFDEPDLATPSDTVTTADHDSTTSARTTTTIRPQSKAPTVAAAAAAVPSNGSLPAAATLERAVAAGEVENEEPAKPNHNAQVTSSSLSTDKLTPLPYYRTAVQRFFYPKATAAAAAAATVEEGEVENNFTNSTSAPTADSPLPPSSSTQNPLQLSTGNNNNSNNNGNNTAFTNDFGDMNDPDVQFVHGFWTTFDDILILSIFTQLGIVFRLASSTWFTFFDGVFSSGSALFVNLPLNCLSCFFMGLLSSGELLLDSVIASSSTSASFTRFSPSAAGGGGGSPSHSASNSPRRRRRLHYNGNEDEEDNVDEDDDDVDKFNNDGIIREGPPKFSIDDDDDDVELNGSTTHNGYGMRRRQKRQRHINSHNSKKRKVIDRQAAMRQFVQRNAELREVQLLALERRIRMSKCLVLFPVRKEDVDVMEHYFDGGYKKRRDPRYSIHADRLERSGDYDDEHDNEAGERGRQQQQVKQWNDQQPSAATPGQPPRTSTRSEDPLAGISYDTAMSPASERSDESVVSPEPESNSDYIAEFTTNVQENVQENIERFRRVNLVDGWNSGTTPEAMSDDLLLGLRDGFCGALSSFSSWNSAMVALMRNGHFGHAFVGYMLGLQLPIIAYRFGQHVAVYIFIWRTRRETRIDERRGGYGIRVSVNEESDHGNDEDDANGGIDSKKEEKEMPSLRAVITAFFVLALVTQCTSISFFTEPSNQQIALSLLFSPLGVFARWRIAKLNVWKPTFPLGTFTCNILACALSGSLGSLLAGNPGPRERIVLVSIVAGFGGTLSSVAAFVVEVLAGVDPLLFRFDGIVYAVASIGCAMVVGFVFSGSAEWADITSSTESLVVNDNVDDDHNQTRW